jgi:hypothetical protein
MRGTIGRIAAAGGLAVLCGCASGPAYQAAEVPPAKAVVYVYRPFSMLGGAIQPTVTCGSEGVSLAPGGYHAYVVEPGAVTCGASTEASDAVEVKAVAGEPSYVKEEIGVGVFAGHPHLYLVEASRAESEIAKCKRKD